MLVVRVRPIGSVLARFCRLFFLRRSRDGNGNAILLRAGTSWDSGADDGSGCRLSAALLLGRDSSCSRNTEVRSGGWRAALLA